MPPSGRSLHSMLGAVLPLGAISISAMIDRPCRHGGGFGSLPIPVYDGLRLVLEQLEIGYQNGKRVRIAFTLDGCVIRLS